MQMTGDGIFEIQLAHHAAGRGCRPRTPKGTLLGSRARDLRVAAPVLEGAYEPMDHLDVRRRTVQAIYSAKPVRA